VPFVLDASIAGCWCLHDEHDPRADAAWYRLERENALAPIQWWSEIRNVVLQAERQKRIAADYAVEYLQQLLRFPIRLAELPDQIAVLALARKHRLTFYDATYLELAKREGLPLATLDKELANAARAESVPLVAAT